MGAISGSGKITVRKNTGANVGVEPRLNFIEGANITLTIADDAVDNEIDITIAAAVGTHNLLSATHPDTTAAAVVRGDIIIGKGASPAWARLAIGAATTVLHGGTEPSYSQVVDADIAVTYALLTGRAGGQKCYFGTGTGTAPEPVTIDTAAAVSAACRFDTAASFKGLIGNVQTAGQLSGSSLVDDIVIRSQSGRILLDLAGTTLGVFTTGGGLSLGHGNNPATNAIIDARGTAAANTLFGRIINTSATGAAGYRGYEEGAANFFEFGHGGTGRTDLLQNRGYGVAVGGAGTVIGSTGNQPIIFISGGVAAANEIARFSGNTGLLGIGQTTPTAVLHLKAGTASANTGPLKFASGTNLTTPEAGTMEYNGTSLFFTPSASRLTVPFLESANIFTADQTIRKGTAAFKLDNAGGTNSAQVRRAGGSQELMQIGGASGALTNVQLGYNAMADGNNILDLASTTCTLTGLSFLPRAGAAGAGTAPIKFTSGTNMTTPEAGAMEYDGTDLFFTAAATRHKVGRIANVNTVNPTAPNRTIEISISGTTYYLAAKTTND